MLMIFKLKTLLYLFRLFISDEINFVEALHFLPVLCNSRAILYLNAYLDVFLRQPKKLPDELIYKAYKYLISILAITESWRAKNLLFKWI